MWSLRQKQTGEFYLTYDKYRRFTNNLKGLWEHVGNQGTVMTTNAVRVNQEAGLLCCDDDEGGTRVLVLEET